MLLSLILLSSVFAVTTTTAATIPGSGLVGTTEGTTGATVAGKTTKALLSTITRVSEVTTTISNAADIIQTIAFVAKPSYTPNVNSNAVRLGVDLALVGVLWLIL